MIIDTELGREDHGSIPTTTVPTNTANRKTLAPFVKKRKTLAPKIY
jgi:hypothetical protein